MCFWNNLTKTILILSVFASGALNKCTDLTRRINCLKSRVFQTLPGEQFVLRLHSCSPLWRDRIHGCLLKGWRTGSRRYYDKVSQIYPQVSCFRRIFSKQLEKCLPFRDKSDKVCRKSASAFFRMLNCWRLNSFLCQKRDWTAPTLDISW